MMSARMRSMRERDYALRQIEELEKVKGYTAVRLSQSALDVKYKGSELDMRLVEKLCEIERKLEYNRNKIEQIELKWFK